MTWPKLLKLRKEQNQWDNPEASTGVFIRYIGKHVCHEATGPAREIFDQQLGKEIKAILDGCGNSLQQTVIWSIYMIGRTKESATPKVIFSCTDEAARKEVRTTIKDSGILRKYPGIGTGDSSLPPDFNTLIQELATADSECVTKNAVLCTSSDITFGKQIFIKCYNGDSQPLRKATAGGVVRFKDESYYLTVAHAFEKREKIPWSAKTEDCPFEIDFDGQSDADDDYEEDIDVESTSRGSLTPKDARTEGGFSSDDSSDVSNLPDDATRSHDPATYVADLAEANDRLISLTPTSKMTERPPDTPTHLEVVGDLALTSSEDPNSSLDVALVRLHDQTVYNVNKIPLGPEPGAPCLYSEKIAKIESEDAEIVTVTASGGFLRGRLSATPTYMRLPHCKNFQKVYTVQINGTIVDGDCGSLVVHSANGDLYGHIIAGSPGTGMAYIIPATQVFEDLEQRLGGAVRLPTRHGLPPLHKNDTISSQIMMEIIDPSPQDSFKPLSPTHKEFENRSLRRSSQRIDDDIVPPFQLLGLGGKKDKAKDSGRSLDFEAGRIVRRRSLDFEAGKIVRRRSSGGSKRPSCYYEYYCIEKSSNDWTVADRILIKAPQDELEKRVTKSKSRNTVLDSMMAMHPLRRDQINRLLGEKNGVERDQDAEWVPVLIETKRQRGRQVLSFDIIIAQSVRVGRPTFRDRRPSFVGERSDLREPIRSKEKYRDSSYNRKWNDHEDDPFDDMRVFTNDGRPHDRHGVPFDGQRFNRQHVPLEDPVAGSIPGLQPIRPAPIGWTDPIPQDMHHNPPLEILPDNHQPYGGQAETGVLNLDDLLTEAEHGGGGGQQRFDQPHLENFAGAGPGEPRETGRDRQRSWERRHSGSRIPRSTRIYTDQGQRSRREHSRRHQYVDSSVDDEDEDGSIFSSRDDRSSISSYSEDHERFIKRQGSLERRPLLRREEQIYREHHRWRTSDVVIGPRGTLRRSVPESRQMITRIKPRRSYSPSPVGRRKSRDPLPELYYPEDDMDSIDRENTYRKRITQRERELDEKELDGKELDGKELDGKELDGKELDEMDRRRKASGDPKDYRGSEARH